MIRPRTILLTMAASALALSLTACKDEPAAGGSTAASAEPIANISAPAGKKWMDQVAITPEGGYLMGNPDAPIKVIEFGSLTCSHCAAFAEEGFPVIRDKYVSTGRVSFEFRTFIRDPIDLTAAMLTRCGTPQSYFALTDQVFANQVGIQQNAQAKGEAFFQEFAAAPEDKRYQMLAEGTGLTQLFAASGIARDQANACLAKGDEAKKLADATQAQSQQYGIEVTPTFLINGEKQEGATIAVLEPVLQRLGAR